MYINIYMSLCQTSGVPRCVLPRRAGRLRPVRCGRTFKPFIRQIILFWCIGERMPLRCAVSSHLSAVLSHLFDR